MSRIGRQSRYPYWKVYSPSGKYLAACHYVEDAAAIVAAYGDGAEVRWGHKLVCWTDGKDGSAGESYDNVAAVANARLDNHQQRGGIL